jgi:hypothetical protein
MSTQSVGDPRFTGGPVGLRRSGSIAMISGRGSGVASAGLGHHRGAGRALAGLARQHRTLLAPPRSEIFTAASTTFGTPSAGQDRYRKTSWFMRWSPSTPPLLAVLALTCSESPEPRTYLANVGTGTETDSGCGDTGESDGDGGTGDGDGGVFSMCDCGTNVYDGAIILTGEVDVQAYDPNITHITGGLTIVDVTNLDSPFLFPQLRCIDGALHVSGEAPNISSFAGLGSLTCIGALSIQNMNYFSFSGLNSLRYISGNFVVESAYVHDMNGLDWLETVDGSILLKDTHLDDLEGFGSLTNIAGDFEISTSQLTSFYGLDSLHQIGGDLVISHHWSADDGGLQTLEGLEFLTSIGKDLVVFDNFYLNDIDALLNVTALGGNLSVQGNLSLPTCAAEAIAENLTLNGWTGKSVIAGNDDAGMCP